MGARFFYILSTTRLGLPFYTCDIRCFTFVNVFKLGHAAQDGDVLGRRRASPLEQGGRLGSLGSGHPEVSVVGHHLSEMGRVFNEQASLLTNEKRCEATPQATPDQASCTLLIGCRPWPLSLLQELRAARCHVSRVATTLF